MLKAGVGTSAERNAVSGCVNVCRLLGTACPFASGFMGCSDIPSVDSVLPSEEESLLWVSADLGCSCEWSMENIEGRSGESFRFLKLSYRKLNGVGTW